MSVWEGKSVTIQSQDFYYY